MPSQKTGGLNAEAAEALSEELLNKYEKYVNPGMARLLRFMGLTGIEWEGDGAIVRDPAGKEYIDCSSGYAVMNMGHRHPRIVAAVEEQLRRLPQSLRTLINQPMVELAELLAAVTPGDLRCSFFCHSGTEAVEAALKLARIHTGKMHVVATHHGFHGKTLGSLAATGNPVFREPVLPLLGGVTHVPYGNAAAIEAAITPDTAAVILEPIQGEAGVVIPPEGYLREVREVCDRHGVLMILDEVQTGMARTGKLFACEHEGVTPDMMTLAKALGGGVMPIGAVVGRPGIFQVFDENPVIHTVTMGGNPLACVAARAAIQVCLDEDLPGQAAAKGAYVMERLRGLQARYPRVLADVRGRGLLIGLEMTRPGAGGMFLADLIEQGVLVIPSLNNFAILRISPPLTIPYGLIDRALAAVEAALGRVDEVVEEL